MSVVFTDFWPFVAFCVVLVIIFSGIESIIRAWRGEKDEEES